ncbi:MAG: putative membrane protein SirB2 [Sphingobacteriales bacterium]|jgi:uncharacterized membrane protein SirB2
MEIIKVIHITSATMFLVFLMLKLVFLYMDKNLNSKLLKIADMAISLIFLVTGVYLLAELGFKNLGGWFHLKFTLIIVGIPMTIVAFRKRVKSLATIGTFLFIYVYALSENKDPSLGLMEKTYSDEEVYNPESAGYDLMLHGERIYYKECALCHGGNGDKGLSEAAFLSTSLMEDAKIDLMVSKGTGAMPAFEHRLDPKEIFAVREFIKTLRK